MGEMTYYRSTRKVAGERGAHRRYEGERPEMFTLCLRTQVVRCSAHRCITAARWSLYVSLHPYLCPRLSARLV